MFSIEIAQKMLDHLKNVEYCQMNKDWVGILRTIGRVKIEGSLYNIDDRTYEVFLFKLSFCGEHIYDVLKKCYEKIGTRIKFEIF